MSGAELSHSQLMGGEEGICPAWGCPPVLALKVCPGTGASGDLHSPNAGTQLATRSSVQAPAPGKGCTPSLLVKHSLLHCRKHKNGSSSGKMSQQAPALLPGWGRSTIQHPSGRAGHCPLCATSTVLAHLPQLSPQQDTAPAVPSTVALVEALQESTSVFPGLPPSCRNVSPGKYLG